MLIIEQHNFPGQFRNKAEFWLAVQSEKRSKILPSYKTFYALSLSSTKTKFN